MTQQQIWRTALEQSALECGCAAEDFARAEPVVTRYTPHPAARKYLPQRIECNLVYYGQNVVAVAGERTAAALAEYLQRTPPYRCFETPAVYALNELLQPYALRVCFMAEYWLPDLARLRPQPCPYLLRVLDLRNAAVRAACVPLYADPAWGNALCGDDPARDVLLVGAYDGDALVGLAGCSADCDTMYQIGVDVLPACRRQGVAAALTSRLALEILKLGKVPFYCCAWSNVASARNAFRSGFAPAWVEMTARDADFVERMVHPQ